MAEWQVDNLSIYHFQVVSCGFRNPPLFTVTYKVFLLNDALCHSTHQLAILTS